MLWIIIYRDTGIFLSLSYGCSLCTLINDHFIFIMMAWSTFVSACLSSNEKQICIWLSPKGSADWCQRTPTLFNKFRHLWNISAWVWDSHCHHNLKLHGHAYIGGFKQTTLSYCYNRRRSKKAQPCKAKPFSTCTFKSFITKKNKYMYESSSPTFANLWLLLRYPLNRASDRWVDLHVVEIHGSVTVRKIKSPEGYCGTKKLNYTKSLLGLFEYFLELYTSFRN